MKMIYEGCEEGLKIKHQCIKMFIFLYNPKMGTKTTHKKLYFLNWKIKDTETNKNANILLSCSNSNSQAWSF